MFNFDLFWVMRIFAWLDPGAAVCSPEGEPGVTADP